MAVESIKPDFESEGQKNKLEYQKLITDYSRDFREIKKIERRSGKTNSDPETQALILFLDKERHQTHLKLVELGLKFGKNKADVLIDILSQEGNLEEYGLPEFTVKKSEDFSWEGPKQLNDNEVLLVFDYTTADYGGGLIYSEDHEERMKRAKLLAEELGGRLLSIDEGFSHESTETIGVALPKKDLEKVASVVRDNPKKFRLGEEYYK